MSEGLETSVRQGNGLAIIQFRGDVTTFAEEAMQSAYHEASRGNVRHIALDFTSCEYINSAGIAVIIGVVTEARRKGQDVYAFGLSSHYQKLFRMVGLMDYMVVCDSEAETLKRIGERV